MSVKTDNVNLNVVINGTRAGKSLNDLEKAAKAIRMEMKHLKIGSEEYINKMKELQKVDKQLRQTRDEIRGVGGAFSKVKDEIKAFGMIAAGYLGFQFITEQVRNLIKRNGELSDSLANISKTTGMSTKEVKELNSAFSKLNTRTATKDLREIAVIAGQLGVAKKDILGFTVAVDKAVVALGDEFTGGAEQVSKELGALRNIFSDVKSDAIDEDLLHIGNALNELGAAGAATGPVMADFASRIGGIGIPLGLTSGQVLGLSATLQELNVSTERGGTAITKILQKMASDTAEFATVAGVPLQEFKKLVNDDLYGAFVKVVEGSKTSGTSATALSNIISDLGIEGAGASEVFLKLGSNTALLNDKVKLASTSLKETTSITNEFNIKNETLAAKLDKIGKAISGAFVNSGASQALESMVGWIAKLTETKLSETMEEERMQLGMMQLKLKDVNLSHADRVKLINELKERYPDYLANINAETVSNIELDKSIAKINSQLINKIVLQKKDEEIAEQNEKAAERKMNMLTREDELLKVMNKARQNFNLTLKDGLTTEQQVFNLQQQMEKLTPDIANSIKIPGNMASAYQSLGHNLHQYKLARESANSSDKKSNDILAERQALEARLGLKSDSGEGYRREEEKTAATAKGVAARIELTKEEEKAAKEAIEKQLKEFEHLQAEIQKLEDEAFLRKFNKDDQEIINIQIKYATLIDLAKGHEQQIKDLEAMRDQELAIKKDEQAAARALANEQLFQEAIDQEWAIAEKEGEIIRDKNRKEVDEEKKKNEEIKKAHEELQRALKNKAIDIASEAANTIAEVQAEKRNRAHEGALKQLEDRRVAELNKHNLTEAEKDKINTKYDREAAALKRGAFEREQRAAANMAIINGALAVMKAYASMDPISATIAAVGIAVTTGIQVAKINSQQVPQFAKGGLLNGRSHDAGGMAVVDETGRKVAEVEGGEPVLSRATYENNKSIVNALLDSSMNRGGTRINLDNLGAPAFNIDALAPRMAAGGIMPGSSNNSGNGMPADNVLLLAAINRLNYNLENPRPAAAVFDFDYYTRSIDKVDVIKDLAKVQ